MKWLSENKKVTQPPLYDIVSDFNNSWPDPSSTNTLIEGRSPTPSICPGRPGFVLSLCPLAVLLQVFQSLPSFPLSPL